jgi:hypothetical protein
VPELIDGWAEILLGVQRAWARIGNWASRVPPPIPLSSYSSLGARLIEIAQKEIGNGEEGGNNRGPDIDRYRAGHGGRGSWCAAFVSYCLEKAYADFEQPMPFRRSHGAKALWRRAAKAGAAVTVPNPGDLVCWHRGPVGGWQGHIGIVSRAEGESFWSIEGNVGRVPAKVAEFKHSTREKKLFGFARLSKT